MTAPALIVSGSAARNLSFETALGGFLLQQDRGPISVHVCRAAGDAPGLARAALERGVKRIIAVGGDGTVQEVASVVAGVEGVTMGIVPLGTGNDFARQLNLLDSNLGRALETALGERVKRFDIGDMDGRTWVNLCSLGPVARVAPSAARSLKAVLGPLAYVVTAIEQLTELKPFKVRLHGPDFEISGPFLALFVGNGGSAGGGRQIIPDTRMDDGLLDILAVRYPEGTDIVSVLGNAMLQKVHQDAHAWTVRTPWIELEVLEGEPPVPVSLDGEPVEITRARFSCVPQRIDIAIPEEVPAVTAEEPGAAEEAGAVAAEAS